MSALQNCWIFDSEVGELLPNLRRKMSLFEAILDLAACVCDFAMETGKVSLNLFDQLLTFALDCILE
jgi:hypothetical protein